MIRPVKCCQHNRNGLKEFLRNDSIHIEWFQERKQIWILLDRYAIPATNLQNSIRQEPLTLGDQAWCRIKKRRFWLVAKCDRAEAPSFGHGILLNVIVLGL